MDELLKTFFSVKEKKSFGPTVETGFPPELHEMAKKLIKSNKQEYLILPIYDIIILNLEKEKQIENIMSGLYNLAKYPLCLFLDPERPEFHQIRTFSGFYTYEIKEKLDRFEPILESFGYHLEGQIYKLDQNKLKDHNFPKTLATIGCELLLAYEELSVFNEMRKMVPNTIPTQHFKSQKQLQLSRLPPDKANPNLSTNNQMPNAFPPNEIEDSRSPFDKGTGQYENPPGFGAAPPPVGTETHGGEQFPLPTQNSPQYPGYTKYGESNEPSQYHYNQYNPEFRQQPLPNVPYNSEPSDRNAMNYNLNNAPPKAGGDGVPSNHSGRQDFHDPNSIVNPQRIDYANNTTGRNAYEMPTNPEFSANNDPKYASKPEQYNRFPPPIPTTSQFTDRNSGNYGQNPDQYQNAGQMPPNPNFQNRGDPNYAPRADEHYRPPQIPLKSQLSNPNLDISRNPPSSGSQSGIEPNYTSNPDPSRHNAPLMQSDYQFPGHNPANYPDKFRYSSPQNQPNYRTPESIDQRDPELSNRNPGDYPPSSSVPKHLARGLDDQGQYEMRRGEQLGRDAQHQMRENPQLTKQLSDSRDAGVNDPPSRPHETSTSSIRDAIAGEHPNPTYSSQTIQDPTSNAPHVYQPGRDGMEQQAMPHTPISIENSGHKIPPPFNPNLNESERMAVAPGNFPQGELGIYSNTPRGIEPGSSNQTQIRKVHGLSGIDENSARPIIPAPETPGVSEYNQNYGETKIQPFPTQAPDRFATTSAFNKSATDDLYETRNDPPQTPPPAPNVPARQYTEHANQMQNEKLYSNSEEINRHRETNQGYATHGPTPAKVELQQQADQRPYGVTMPEGPQQVPIEQHTPYGGSVEQFGPRQQFSGVQQPHGHTPGGRPLDHSSPHFYEQPNTPERQGINPEQARIVHQPSFSGVNMQCQPKQHFSGKQEPPNQVAIQGNIGQTGGGNYPERHPQDQRSSLQYGQENMAEVSHYNSGHQQAPMGHQLPYGSEYPNPRQQHSGRQEPIHSNPTVNPNPTFPQQPPQTAPNYQAAMPSQQAYHQHGGNPPQAANYSSYMTNIPSDAQGSRQPVDRDYNQQPPNDQMVKQNPYDNQTHIQHHEPEAPNQATGQLHSSGGTSYQNPHFYQGDVARMHDSGAYQPTGEQTPGPGLKPGEGPPDHMMMQRRYQLENNPRDFSQPVGPNPNPRDGHNMQNAPEPYRMEQRPYPGEGYPSHPQKYLPNPDDIYNQRDPYRAPPEQRLPQTPWECKHCTFENSSDKKVCEICSKSRDFNLDVPATPFMRKCEVCQKLNPVEEKNCQSCHRTLFNERY